MQDTDVDFDKLLPFQLADYIFTQKIGSGAFSSAYLVRSTKYENENFCAKVAEIDESILDSEGNLCESEIAALTSLNHPNIIRIYDFFISCTNLIIILEFCDYGTLEDEIKSINSCNTNEQCPCHGICEKRFTLIAKCIADALLFCHRKEIAHRDIKPSNVFIDKYGRAKLADFGLALYTHGNSNTVCGTMNYLAPEVIAFQNGITKSGFSSFKNNSGSFKNNSESFKSGSGSFKSGSGSFNRPDNGKVSMTMSTGETLTFNVFEADIYALGVTFYEMAVGTLPPFILDKKYKGPLFPETCTLNNKLKNLIQNMLSADPSMRPNAFDLVNNLERLLNQSPTLISVKRNNSLVVSSIMTLKNRKKSMSGVLSLGDKTKDAMAGYGKRQKSLTLFYSRTPSGFFSSVKTFSKKSKTPLTTLPQINDL
ncbi:hypothetical protein TRFO_25103 [Tritrichomonas foetus]|uniref:Protein kinase domain-containing protein n=1 Tax=Tritrichomonas foetus TaxID=1144522 RepID=A0A1J4K5R8_9EUKA|nr:hypothetical protein TRFO_25103 [Tritrichomonas foetus]|eukprot:OHT06801.1 hypothetical protein TRFO_25103 [Tritrichomonas foetus]